MTTTNCYMEFDGCQRAVVRFGLALSLALSASLTLSGQVPNQLHAPEKLPGFEIASVRLVQDYDRLPLAQQLSYMSPSGTAHFIVRNVTLDFLIGWAFKIDPAHQLSGKPTWMDSTFYAIEAKPDGDVALSYEQLRPLVQQLLQERFHLAFHHETKNFKGYALVVAKGGSKLTPTNGRAQHVYLLTDGIDAANLSVNGLAGMFAHALRQPVVDQTGLKGDYDIKLNYAPMEAVDSPLPSIFTAVEEQLGLKLEKQVVSWEIFVIDHVDRVPTEN